MGLTAAWLQIELRRRWRSLVVLALLIAIATGTVLTAVAGARRGDSSVDRLLAETVPARAVVAPFESNFDWAAVRALPQVESLSTIDCCAYTVDGLSSGGVGSASEVAHVITTDSELTTTVERPVVLAGRLTDPTRADEVVITARYAELNGVGVGDTLELGLYRPETIDPLGNVPLPAVADGPTVPVRVVGVIRWFFLGDEVGSSGHVVPSVGVFNRYRPNLLGAELVEDYFGLVRLRGWSAALPDFQAELVRITGRPDVGVTGPEKQRRARDVVRFEAIALLAFGLAALIAAAVLVGQAVVRYATVSIPELRLLRGVGMTRRQSAASRCRAVRGRARRRDGGHRSRRAGVAMDALRRRCCLRTAPRPGCRLGCPRTRLDAGAGARRGCRRDRRHLGAGGTAAGRINALVRGGTGGGVRGTAGAGGRRRPLRARTRPRAQCSADAPGPDRRGHWGRGRADGVHRRGGRRRRRGPPGALRSEQRRGDLHRHLRAGRRSGGSDLGDVGRPPGRRGTQRWVLRKRHRRQHDAQGFQQVGGRHHRDPSDRAHRRSVPTGRREVVLAPTSARQLAAGIGSTITVRGDAGSRELRVVGIGLVAETPGGDYAEGAWVTLGAFGALFSGFDGHGPEYSFHDGVDPAAATERVAQALAAIPGAERAGVYPSPVPQRLGEIRNVQVRPVLLGGVPGAARRRRGRPFAGHRNPAAPARCGRAARWE